MRGVLKNVLLVTIPTLVLLAIVLELVFRFVIPASRQPVVRFDPEYSLLRYDTDGPTRGVFSAGALAQLRGRWRVNNAGWISAIDYLPAGSRDKPLIAVIGDSYVDALQVNAGETLVDVLRRRVEGTCDVYGFGMSGAPLSHYLHMARYVRREFRPQVIVFIVVHNDFDESFTNVVRQPQFLQFSWSNDAWNEVLPVGYVPSRLRRLGTRSALVRYLWTNLHVDATAQRVLRRGPEARFAANIDLDRAAAHRSLVERGVPVIVQWMDRENRSSDLVFVMDAPKQDVYAHSVDSSEVLWLRDVLRGAASGVGAGFVDLTEPMRSEFEASGTTFSSPYDGHWNQAGHDMAAREIDRYLREAQLPCGN